MAKFSGPVRPGTSESTFRRTGKTVEKKRTFSGPVRPGTSESTFRKTGMTVKKSSSSSAKRRAAAQRAATQKAATQKALEFKRKIAAAKSNAIQQQAAARKRDLEIRRIQAKAGERARAAKTMTGLQRQRMLISAQVENKRARELITKQREQVQSVIAATRRPVGFTQSEVEKIKQEKKLGALEKIQKDTERQLMKGQKTQQKLKQEIKKSGITPKEKSKLLQQQKRAEIGLAGLELAGVIQRTVTGLKQLPEDVVTLVKNPKNIVKIPGNIARALKEEAITTAQIAKVSPTRAVARIGGNLFILSVGAKGMKITGKVTGSVATRIRPDFAKVSKVGKITTRAIRPSKRVELQLGTIGKGVPLSKQVGFAGKKVTAASVQTDRIVNFINRKKIVAKPIPGQANLKPRTKHLLLEKFDKGKITKKEFIELNDRVLAETGKSMLERSIFADPTGKVRFTRLASEVPEARLKDIVTGNFQLRKPRPQILVFKDLKVAKFPKNLADVKKKLLANKPLSKSEATRLVRWQTKTGGKLKPIGDTKFKGGKELEVTIAPGELIRRKKKLGVTRVNGQNVEIIQAEIFRPKGATKTLINKAKRGTITKKEITILNKRLSKETGFKSTSTRRRPVTTKPQLKPGRAIPKRRPAPRRPTTRKPTHRRPTPRKPKPRRPTPRRPTPRKPTPRRPTPRRPTPRKPTPRRPTPRRPTPRKPTPRKPIAKRPTPKKEVVPTIRARRKKPRRRKQQKRKQAYKVLARPVKTLAGKKAKRSIKINKVPLSKTNAKNLRNYVADTSISRRATIKPTGGKPKPGRLKVPSGYAAKTGIKFRNYRTVKGKRVPLTKGQVIERRKRLLDTRQEKQQIELRRRIKQIDRKPVRKKVTKKKSTKRKPIKRKGSSKSKKTSTKR